MSTALLRQALEFVDQEGVVSKKRQRRPARGTGQGQHQFKNKVKKRSREVCKTSEQVSEETVKKLLALSEPVASTEVTAKIVERAVKGKPLSDFIPIKEHEEEKSILFPEESYKKFEEELFCS